MTVHVCLLRAIGPGTHEKMSMAALGAACAKAGFKDLTTVGNTGNVILRSDRSAAEVRAAVQAVVDGFGITSEVFVRTARQMQMVVRANPFPDAARDRPSTVGVCSFHKAPDWKKLEAYKGPVRLATSGAHLIADYPPELGNTQFDIEKLLGARMTQRNWRVFAGLAEKAAALAKTRSPDNS